MVTGTALDLYEIARPAAWSALHRLGCPRVVAQDVEDLVQEAALGAWKAQMRGESFPDADREAGYVFGAAVREALKGAARRLFGRHPRTLETELPLRSEPQSLARPVRPQMVWGIYYLMRQARKQQTGRAERAARRDAVICVLLLKGYTNQGIAQELGLPVRSVQTYRRRIRSILAQAPVLACAACGRPAQGFHHIVPRRAGGQDTFDNVVPVCGECHAQAENWTLRQERPGLSEADWRNLHRAWLEAQKCQEPGEP